MNRRTWDQIEGKITMKKDYGITKSTIIHNKHQTRKPLIMLEREREKEILERKRGRGPCIWESARWITQSQSCRGGGGSDQR